MYNLVIFGAPGSGKGTQSERIIDKYGLHHISTGDLLRRMIAEGTDLGKTADSYISQGQLIPDDLMVQILGHEVDRKAPEVEGFIFDGFPRTIPQAKALKKMMADKGHKIDAVIGLEVDDDELMNRLVNRGKTSGRADDNPETIAKRLKVYHDQTSPLRDHYTCEGIYRPVKGTGTIDGIFEQVCHAIDDSRKK